MGPSPANEEDSHHHNTMISKGLLSQRRLRLVTYAKNKKKKRSEESQLNNFENCRDIFTKLGTNRALTPLCGNGARGFRIGKNSVILTKIGKN